MNDEWSKRTTARFHAAADDEPLFAPPTSFTKSGGMFYADQSNVLRFYKETVDVAIFADNAAHVSSLMVKGSTDLPSGFDPFRRIGEGAGPFEKRVKRNGRLLSEMAVNRLIDNFSSYLSDVIGECITSKPDVLRSKEQLSYETILQFEDMSELRSMMLDKKISELSYAGFGKLTEWMEDRLGVALSGIPAKDGLLYLYEVRNCVVHNRSKVSAKLATIDPTLTRQAPIDVDGGIVFLATVATAETVSAIDTILSEKFGLKLETLGIAY